MGRHSRGPILPRTQLRNTFMERKWRVLYFMSWVKKSIKIFLCDACHTRVTWRGDSEVNMPPFGQKH